MQIIDVTLEQNNLGTAVISETIDVTVEALNVKQMGVYPAEISEAVAAHVADLDPHTQYALEADLGTAAEQDVTAFEPAAGMPASDDYVWSSKADGTRSWVAKDSGTQGIQGEPGQNGVNGTDGADGLSAYEIAVINGFAGTEAQWLESLTGADGAAGGAADTAALTHAATSKTTPANDDEIPLVDSTDSWTLKKLTWTNLKATLKTYFDSLTTTLSNKRIILSAGSATAGTASLKFAAGVLLTIAESGTMEWIRTAFYLTPEYPDASVKVAVYPTAYSSTYIKSAVSLGSFAIMNPATNMNSGNIFWANGTTLNVVFYPPSPFICTRLHYQNYINTLISPSTNYGCRAFTLWGTNTDAAFIGTYKSDADMISSGWTQLTTDISEFDIHAASPLNDLTPKYITVTNTTSYKYYQLKITTNWGAAANIGIGKIEFEQDDPTAYTAQRSQIITDNGTVLTEGTIPVATTFGRIINSLMTISTGGSPDIPAGQTYQINGVALAKGDVGLGNVTNDAQVKKISSSVDNSIAAWDGTTGDAIQAREVTIDDVGAVVPVTDSVADLGTASLRWQYLYARLLRLKGLTTTDSATLDAELLDGTGWTLGYGWTGDFATGFIWNEAAEDPPPAFTTITCSKAIANSTRYQVTITGVFGGGYLTVTLGGQSRDCYGADAWGPTTISTATLAITPSAGWAPITPFTISIKKISAISTAFNQYVSSDGVTQFEQRITAALGNLILGVLAGRWITTGSMNVALGYGALGVCTTGYQNVAIGYQALNLLKTAYGNMGLGYQALYGITSGNSNVGIGMYAGRSITTGNGNIFIGGFAGYQGQTATINNSIGIGSNTAKDYQMVLGWTGITETVLRGAQIQTAAAVTVSSAGVALSVAVSNIEVTTDGDSDEDNGTLAAGVAGQILYIGVKAVGNAADSFKVTPATMVGGTKISFAANPLGKGCVLMYTAAGWLCVGNNGGVIS